MIGAFKRLFNRRREEIDWQAWRSLAPLLALIQPTGIQPCWGDFDV